MKNFIKFSALFLSGMVAVKAQDRDTYLTKAAEPGANFFEITKAIENGFAKKRSSAKGNQTPAQKKIERRAWKQYQRWKLAHKNYLNPDGTFANLNQGFESAGIIDSNGQLVSRKAARNALVDANDIYNANNWSNVGAQNLPNANGSTNTPQMGRISNFFRLNNATDANGHVLFVATPNGGLFKSTNNGATWVAKMDNLASMGTTDMRGASDLTAANYTTRPIYVSTGDFDGGDTKSLGVLKSMDGGETFQSTGLSYTTLQNRITSNLIVIDDNTVVVADNAGIKRTTNGGTTWTTVKAAVATDGVIGRFVRSGNNLMATNANGGIYRSTNGGVNWTQVRANDAVKNRLALAVNDQGVFYAINSRTRPNLANGNPNPICDARLMRFNTTTNVFDLIGTTLSHEDISTQGDYNLSLMVDGNLVMAGGVSGFTSNDLGQTWTRAFPWNWDNTPQYATGGTYVHADHHASGKIAAGQYWDANDGGLSFINLTATNSAAPGATYKTSTMLNAMQYSVGINPNANTNDYIVGNQDNGSFSNVAGTWYAITTGDGIENAVNYLNPNIRYTTSYDTNILRSTTGFNGQIDGNANCTLPDGKGLFTFPFEMHSTTPTTLYGATTDVYKMSDNTAVEDAYRLDANGDYMFDTNGNYIKTRTAITITDMNAGFNGTDEIKGLSTHGNVIVANTANVIRKTINTNLATPTWANVAIPANTTNLVKVDFSQADHRIMYAINSSAVAGQKVYRTANNGTAWTNISDTLPNVGLNKIVLYQNQNTEILFLATNVGVYYKTAASATWFKLGQGLPNVKVTDIEINYNSNQLIASTYGRGLWRINLVRPVALDTDVINKEKLSFAVAPIPANDHVKVQLDSDHAYQYQIYNAVGGIMQAGDLSDDRNIDTSLLPNAYYVLRIYNENESYTKNIIIKR
jgi:xyloglucan-specific exo-beta-1,4-glucanase